MNLIFLLVCYYWTERMKHEYEVTYWTSLFRVLRRQGIINIMYMDIILLAGQGQDQGQGQDHL